MSAIADGIEFDCDGVLYVFPRVVQGDKKLFHRWANARALMELDDLAESVKSDDLSPERYQQQQRLVGEKVATGWFHFDEQGGRERLFTVPGLTHIAFICMSRVNKAVTREKVEKIVADNGDAWLFAKYLEANADPNAKAPPATTKAGETESQAISSTPT